MEVNICAYAHICKTIKLAKITKDRSRYARYRKLQLVASAKVMALRLRQVP